MKDHIKSMKTLMRVLTKHPKPQALAPSEVFDGDYRTLGGTTQAGRCTEIRAYVEDVLGIKP